VNEEQNDVVWRCCLPNRIESSALLDNTGQFVVVGTLSFSFIHCFIHSFIHTLITHVLSHHLLSIGLIPLRGVHSTDDECEGCYDYNVYVLSSVSGEVVWKFLTGHQVKCSPTQDPHTGLIWVLFIPSPLLFSLFCLSFLVIE
jgi:hypothetical protein